MSDLTKTFVVSVVTAAATSVVVYVLMARFDPRFAGRSPAPVPAGVASAPVAAPAAPGLVGAPVAAAAQPAAAAAPAAAPTAAPTAAPAAAPAAGTPDPVKKRVEVPRLEGQPVDQAKAILLERGLLVVLVEARNDDEVPADHVISQTPLSGSIVSRGAEVSVIISKGPLPVEVPDVTGLGVEPAEAMLREAGLRLGRTETRRSEAPKGEIIEMSPMAGQQAARLSVVSIVVSDGPALKEVPKVVRRGVSTARRAIEEAGFVPGRIVWTYDLDFEPGVIVRQEPKGGDMAPKGSEVKLWGSEPE